ncbi:hypothetical protein M5D96_011077 [Drosophila gunungcola]|uniref:Uncharacterized protein n=1 Tax=Drosophila gunungcola TaxID=103775 RepID=A0A9Q0BL51_9MUSC|nr:hypothetical protein M5D96_011077 [Drosophila gunungcola]
MNPFRARVGANHRGHLVQDLDLDLLRSLERSVERRRMRRLLLDHQLNNSLLLCAGDGIYVGNWQEPPMPTGQMGQGDGNVHGYDENVIVAPPLAIPPRTI